MTIRAFTAAARSRSLVGLCTVALAGGCTTTRPPAAGAPDLPPAWSQAAAPEQPPVDAWWQRFGDPRLDALVAEALLANRDLVVAAARLDAALAQARIAGAALAPSVQAGAAGTRSKRNFVGFPSFGPAGGGTDADVLSITNNNFSVSLDLAWELDLWGRLREARSAARETFAAAEADWAAARHSIAGQTAKAWFAAVEADRQWRIALANDRSFTASAERVRARYQRGLRPALDLRAAEAESAAARAVLARRESVRDAALRALELLLGRYPSAALEVQAGLPEVEAPVPAGLPIDLLGRRADLVASERRLEAALAGGREARAALLPSISLTGSMGRSSEELSDLLDGSFGVWQIGGRLVQPIFQGGRLRAAVALADARAAEAAASYGDRVLRAAAEVERALFDDRVAVAEAEALTAAAALSAAAAATAESRYHAGLESFTTLLVQQRARADAEARALEAHRRRLDRRIDLHLALGGGFEAASSAAPKATAETPASTESPS